MLEVILLLTLSKPRITAMSTTRDQDETSHFRSTDAFSINALVFSIMKTHAFFRGDASYQIVRKTRYHRFAPCTNYSPWPVGLDKIRHPNYCPPETNFA